MVYRVDISDQANEDIDEALTWIARHSETSANKWLQALLAAFTSLEQMPNRCPIAPEANGLLIEVRYLIFGEYTLQHRIIFGVSVDDRSENGIVTIYRVRNSRQRPLTGLELLGNYGDE